MVTGGSRLSDARQEGRRLKQAVCTAWKTVWLVALALTACATVPTGLDVTLALESVRRPREAVDRWGDYTLAPADTSGFKYTDQLVSIAIVPKAGSFAAVIENRAAEPISLLWGDAVYVGPTGRPSSVVLEGAGRLMLTETPGVQIVPPYSSATATIVPRANIRGGNTPVPGFYPITAGCDAVRGTHLRLVLPIEVRGATSDYTFEFVPTEAAIARWKEDPDTGKPVVQSRVMCPPIRDADQGVTQASRLWPPQG
jgi:hypothetical protein